MRVKQWVCVGIVVFFACAMPLTAFAGLPGEFNMDEQLEALGREELMQQVPQETQELLNDAQVSGLSVKDLLALSPGQFFSTVWRLLLRQMQKPVRAMALTGGIILLAALLSGVGETAWKNNLAPVFQTVSVLCILTAIVTPILDCIVSTAEGIKNASLFMLGFVPMFSAAVAAAGQPVSGAGYNLFLFGTCQVVSQIVAQTLIPLMSIYLAFCIAGAAAPQMNISSAVATLKKAVNWSLGLLLTFFVGLLSTQTMVAQGADSAAAKTAKFLIGSFVPVVGSALSEAYTTAQGCLRLLRTSVGAYGILVAMFIFLPVLFQLLSWLMVAKVGEITADILGVKHIPGIFKSCGSVISILLAIIMCYALLIIVSTTVILVTGMGL